jgi:Zn-finger nucleic acid-binding protein
MTRPLRCACEAQPELTPVRLAAGPRALACEACGGSCLAMNDYRAWRDGDSFESIDVSAVAIEDCPAARPCPACARFMERVRVGATADFRLDRCAACSLLWLDRGEWEALHAENLAHWLEEVLSERWRRDLQAHEARLRREAVLRDKHGSECMAELARVHRWLQGQKNPDELLALLRAGW